MPPKKQTKKQKPNNDDELFEGRPQLDSRELLEYKNSDLRLRLKTQAIRILELEQKESDGLYLENKGKRQTEISNHKRDLLSLTQEQKAWLEQIAAKYGMLAGDLMIDDETGTLRRIGDISP